MSPLLFCSPTGKRADNPQAIVLQKREDAKWQIAAVARFVVRLTGSMAWSAYPIGEATFMPPSTTKIDPVT